MALRLGVGNLSNVQDSFPVIDEGVYEVQIMKIEMAQSKQGNPMLNLEYLVVNHPEQTGHKLFDRISLVEKALWKLKQFCEAVGLEWDETGVDVEPAIGQTVLVKVTQELYTDPNKPGSEGRRTNKVDEYLKR